ncbi:hypothetical protein EAH87_07580 [Sphingomonas koreensis]|nr:hypothetical protein EAH87_07580 [Sphingomonas koreensis]
MRKNVLLAVASIASAAIARDDPARDLAKALEGHVATKTDQCIDPHLVSGPQVIGHDTLLYRQGGTIWKTTVIGPCPSLDDDVTIINDVYGGQLCRNDRFRTREPGLTIPSAYCRLGGFTKYVPVKR